MPEAYDAFISYSHAADGALAPAVQRGLSRLAKPWYRREALRVFRDDTGLAVTPELWGSIATALDGSRHFVLLASPEAAASEWVNREIEHWKAHKSTSTLLPVLTAGEWVWDERANDLDRNASTAVPAALFGAFTEEPRHLDLRWARHEDHLDLRNGRFRNAVAELAAPLRGVPKEELESEDLRLHRRALRIARAGIASLVVLTVAALIAGGLAIANANRAEDRRVQATARQYSAQALAIEGDSPVEALMLASAAHELDPGRESTDALLDLAQSRPRLDRLLDTTPGATITTTVVSDDKRHAAFVRTEGARTSAVVASIGGEPRPILQRRVDGLEGLSFVGNSHVALFGERLAVMDLDGRVHDIVGRQPESRWVLSPDGGAAVVVGRDGASVVVDLEARRRVASVRPPTPQNAGFVAFAEDGSAVLVPGQSDWRLVTVRAPRSPAPVAFPSTVGLVTPRILPSGAIFGAGEHGLAVLPDPAAGGGAPLVIPLDATADGAYWFDVSRTGELVVVRSQQRRFVAELATGRVLWEQQATPLTSYGGLVQLGFSSSGENVFELAVDGFLVFSSASGAELRRDGTVTEVHVDPRGRRALTEGGTTLSLLDLATGSTIIEHQAFVSEVVWSRDGKYLLTMGGDTDLWHLGRALVPREPLSVTAAFTRGAAFAGRYLVTSGSEAVALWRLGPVAPAGEILEADRDPRLVAFDPDGRGSIRVAATESGYEVKDGAGATLATVPRPGVGPSGVVLLFGSTHALIDHTEGVDLVDLARGKLVRRAKVCGTFEIDQLMPSADGSHVLATLDADAARTGDERLRSCRVSDGRAVGTVTPRAGVTGIAGPNSDGRLAAFPSRGEIHVVDVRRGRETARFAMPGPRTWEGLEGRAVFTPDDRSVVAEWYFGTVVHDLARGRTRSVRRAHVNRSWLPQRIDVDPRGRVAVITAAVGTRLGGLATEISLVDLRSLRVAGPIQVPSIELVTGTRPSASGGAVEVTGIGSTETDDTRTLRVRVDVNPEDLAEDACRLLGHTPTRAEWAERLPATEYVEVCREVGA